MAPPELFVSYAGEDVTIATLICEGLRAQKITLFFAEWERLGDGLVRRLNEGLGNAERFLLCLSPDSVKKGWPVAEQEVATIRNIEEKTPVIVVNLGITDNKTIPPLLRRFQWISVKGKDDVAAAVQEIYRRVRPADSPLAVVLPLVETAMPKIPSEPRLQDNERVVVGLLFRIGIGKGSEVFRVDFDKLSSETAEHGIPVDELKDALDVLNHVNLVEFDRFIGGGIGSVRLSTEAVEACCQEMIENYPQRKSTILAVVAEARATRTTSTDEVIERTGEEPWLVFHVLQAAEDRGNLKLQPIYIGRPFFTVHSISPLLEREIAPTPDYARLNYLLQRRQEMAGPAGIEVDDEELAVIRLIEELGPLKFKSYRETGTPPWSVNAWCLVREEQCVRGLDYAPGSKWFIETLTERLPNRGLANVDGRAATLTENARAVCRREKGREISVPALEWMPMERK